MKNNKIDVLYVHPPHGNDYIIPTGLIGLMNSINCVKMGVMYFEVSDEIIRNSKIVVMDLYWWFPLAEIGRLARRFKQVNPNIIIIVGGDTATIFAEIIIKIFKIDYVIKGDAEFPFRLLVENLLNSRGVGDVPNLVSKDFITPQTYSLTIEDYNRSDCITIDWFKFFKRRVNYIHSKLKRLAAPHEDVIGYPFIPVLKGCIYNCSWCYASLRWRKVLCKNTLVARDHKYVINDLIKCSKDRNISWVYILTDFVNVLGLNYANEILSQKYDINFYFKFYNLPSFSTLNKMIESFNRCFFHFNIYKNDGQGLEMVDLNYLKEIFKYLKFRNMRWSLYYDSDKMSLKYMKKWQREFSELLLGDCKQWKIKIPYPTKDIRHLMEQFKMFYRKTTRIAAVNYAIRKKNYGTSLEAVGRYYWRLKNYDKAAEHFKKVSDLILER